YFRKLLTVKMTEVQVFQKLNQEPSASFSLYKTICSKSGIEFSDLEPKLQNLLKIFRDGVKKNKPLVQLKDELLNLGMADNQVDMFSKQWEKVYSSLVHTTSDTIAINPLLDMEWKFGDEVPINALLVPIPPADEEAVRSFLADFEETLRGGNGTDDIRVGGSLGELSPADFERERRIYLEEIVSRIRLANIGERRRLVSDVIAPRDANEIGSILAWLGTSVASFTGFLFIYSVHDGNYIHVLHDCSFSNGTCRCRWRQQSRVAASIRRRLGRKSIFVRNVGQASWHDILSYYVFQQGIQGPTVFLGGTKSPLPVQIANVRHSGVGYTSELVEAQVSGDGCGLRGELTSPEDASAHSELLLERPKKTRGKLSRVKHCADRIVFKTPTLILTNDPLEICTDPAFKDIRVKHLKWRKAPFLKDIPKKTYPMAFFDILDFYDIKF
ncbi:hypothetical protein JTE90_021788, partial [Oedothorax gibbosus]